MKEIIFKASFGKEDKTVKFVQASGSNGSYHIMIDNFYCGMLIKNENGYRGAFNDKYDFTTADIEILIEIITSAL